MCRLMAYMGPEVLVAEVVLYPSRSIIKVNIPEMLPMASPRPPSCRQITVVASIKKPGRYFNQQFYRTTNSSHILQQSYDARERRNDASLPLHLSYGNLNGDGFGIGWYPPCGPCSRHDTSPCTFTSVTPAWNNLNLSRLAKKLDSGLIFAHVRAAYPGMPVSEQNCHPFAHGQYLFMHNGVVAGFLDIRRRLLAKLSDAAYNSVQSFSSDSAVCFAVFLDQLPNLTERQPPEVLLRAIQDTIATISRIQAESGIVDISLLNFVVSDGRTMVASRFVSSDSEQPASLYFAEGNAYERSREDASAEAAEAAARAEAASAAVRAAGGEAGAAGARAEAFTGEGDYHLQYSGKGARVCLVASEPVTTSAGDWTEVPRNTALVVIREWDGELTLMQAPLSAVGDHPRLPEVQRCLEATTGVTGPPAVSMRPPPSRLVASRQLLSRENSGDYGSPEPPSVTGIQHPSRIKTSRSTQSLHHANGDAGNETEGNMSHHLTGHTGPVVAFCVHGDALFSGSTDATIKVWCLKDCRNLRTLRGHRYPIRQLAIGRESGNKGHDVLLSAGAKTVRIWNLGDCSCVGVLQVADVQGSLKAFAMPSRSDDGLLYVAGQGCTVKAYDIEAADQNTISPRCMSASDDISLVYGCAAPPAAISDAAHGHCAAITSLAIAENVIFSGGADSRIRAWNLKTLKHVHTLRGHRGSVLALCTLPGLLLSGGRDHLLRVWDLDTMVCRRSLQGHTGAVLHIATLPDARQSFGSPFLCDQSNITPSVSSIAAVVAGQSPALDPLGAEPCSPTSRAHSTFFASSSDDGTVRIWSAKTFTCLHVFCCSGGGSAAVLRPAVAVCALSSAYVIAGMPDGSITLFQSEEACADGDTAATATAAVATAAAALHKEAGTSKSAEHLEPAAKRTRLEILTKATDVANEAQAQSAATMRQQLDREFERALRVFTRMQTVSADPSKAEDSFRGAKFLLRLLDSLGAEVKLVQPVDGKNPVVLGRIGTDPSLPTITCYAHYDVQPAMEPEWQTDPWEMQAVDGYWIGRGVSDNKGPLLAFVYAVKELLHEGEGGSFQDGMVNGIASSSDGSAVPVTDQRRRALPANIVFLFEGEEENGSTGFKEAVSQNLQWFEGTKAVLISNTLWVGENRPCLTYGMRGMITLSAEVTGPARDLHSGNEGGVFSEPLADLSKVLASLVDSRSTICVPGFYDDVRPDMLTPALQRLQDSSEFSLEGYRRTLGIHELTSGHSERELLTARWCQPSLSVVDIRVGTAEEAENAHYRFGPTRFSVIPRAAVGKISVRFVPNQNAQTLIDRLTAHIRHEFAKLRSGNIIAVKVHSVGDWWESEPGSGLMSIAEAAVRKEWGETPLLVREGGTMPVASALEKWLKAPALLLPMGQSSDNCHLANERIRRINLLRGKSVIKNIIASVGETFKKG